MPTKKAKSKSRVGRPPKGDEPMVTRAYRLPASMPERLEMLARKLEEQVPGLKLTASDALRVAVERVLTEELSTDVDAILAEKDTARSSSDLDIERQNRAEELLSILGIAKKLELNALAEHILTQLKDGSQNFEIDFVGVELPTPEEQEALWQDEARRAMYRDLLRRLGDRGPELSNEE